MQCYRRQTPVQVGRRFKLVSVQRELVQVLLVAGAVPSLVVHLGPPLCGAQVVLVARDHHLEPVVPWYAVRTARPRLISVLCTYRGVPAALCYQYVRDSTQEAGKRRPYVQDSSKAPGRMCQHSLERVADPVDEAVRRAASHLRAQRQVASRLRLWPGSNTKAPPAAGLRHPSG